MKRNKGKSRKLKRKKRKKGKSELNNNKIQQRAQMINLAKSKHRMRNGKEKINVSGHMSGPQRSAISALAI